MTSSAAFSQLAARCSARETCLSEARAKLERLELTPAQCDAVLQRLVSEGYIDEARYARAFVSDKLRFARWGRLKIRQALRQKGLADDDISQALLTIDEQAYEDTLRTLLAQKRRTLRAATPYDASARLLRFAASRGFEPALTLRLLHLPDNDD